MFCLTIDGFFRFSSQIFFTFLHALFVCLNVLELKLKENKINFLTWHSACVFLWNLDNSNCIRGDSCV